MPLDHAAGRGDQQTEGHVGRGVGQHAGRVADGDAARRGGRDVDVVEADGVVADDLQPRRGVQQGRVDAVGQQRHQAVAVGDLLREHVVAAAAAVRARPRRRMRPECGPAPPGNQSGHEYLRLLHQVLRPIARNRGAGGYLNSLHAPGRRTDRRTRRMHIVSMSVCGLPIVTVMSAPPYPAARAAAVTLERYFRGSSSEEETGATGVAPYRTPPTSKPSSTRRSGPACGAKRATSRKSRSRSSGPSRAETPLLFERPLRSARRPRQGRARGRAAGHPPRRVARRRRAARLGHHAHASRRSASSSKSPRPVCSSSSTTAARVGQIRQRRRARRRPGEDRGREASSLPDCPPLLTSLLGFDAPALGSRRRLGNVLVQLAVSMRAHGRGGSLLVVPAGSDAWRESIVRPDSVRPFRRHSPSSPSSCARRRTPHRARGRRTLDHAVDAIAGLTAVDGATVITDRYELLAFGAKIARRKARTRSSR